MSSTEVSTQVFDAGDEFYPSEFRVSHVGLQQSGSDAVKAGTCEAGDYLVKENGQNLDKAPEFVLMGMTQAWVVSEVTFEGRGGKKKERWLHNEPVTPDNDNRPWRVERADGSYTKYDRTYWLDLMPILEVDVEDEFTIVEPLRMRMGSTKARVAQALKKYLTSLASQKNVKQHEVVIRFGSKLTENKDGESWLEPTFKVSRKAKPDELALVAQWLPVVRALIQQKQHLRDAGENAEAEAVDAGSAKPAAGADDDVHI